MDIREYLEHTGLSVSAFARVAEVPRPTINSIRAGGGASASTVMKLITASGGLITLADLQRKKGRAEA